MLKVTVAEKGGLEHEHLFDVTAVTIGRVQGNLIVLPKPNVSKRHAMVQVEGGTIVLTDLQSTNGTYVNGRRISGPRQLSPEDRVYIGDYILRFSEVQGTTGAIEPTPLPPPPPEEELGQYRATVAMPALQVEPPPPPPEASEPALEVAVDLEVEVAAPPSQESVEQPITSRVAPTSPSVPPISHVQPPPEPPLPAPEVSVPSRLSTLSRRQHLLGDLSTADRYVRALETLAEEAARTIFEGIDPSAGDLSDEVWHRLSDGAMRLLDRLRKEGRIGPEADPYLLTQDLLYEFLGLGPFEELLSDESLTGMLAIGRDQVFLCRGEKVERVLKGFSSEEAQVRVLSRLLAMAGLGKEDLSRPFVEVSLSEGLSFQVIHPPLAVGGRVIRMERCGGHRLVVSDLVAAGLVEAQVADAMRQTLSDGKGLALSGGTREHRRAFGDALLRSLPEGLRMVVLDGGTGFAMAGPGRIVLDRQALAGMGASAAAGLMASLRPDLVVVLDVQVDDLPLLARLTLSGSGLLLGWPKDDLDAAAPGSHLVAMLRLVFPSLPEEGAWRQVRQMVRREAFLTALPDGRCRVGSLGVIE